MSQAVVCRIMNTLTLVFTLLILTITKGSSQKVFSDDFLFGVATSAFQIEGGRDERGENIWDHVIKNNPKLIKDRTNGNVACDSYNLVQEDLNILESLGVNFYRFSIAWSRILPNGLPNEINENGVQYYNKLIDGLLEKNITPVVSMYHWDLPQPLANIGGWTNSLVGDYFVDFAKILFENFGDRVPYWITFNINPFGYGDLVWPPFLNHPGGEYLFYKNILVAHAKVYRLYHNKFKTSQNGQIGIVTDARWNEPATNSVQDQKAAERIREFLVGMVAHPLLKNGDYPEVMKEYVKTISSAQNFSRSFLPELSEEEKKLIKGAVDFYGANVYTTYLMRDSTDTRGSEEPDFKSLNVKFDVDPAWPGSGSSWLKVVPSTMRKFLTYFKRTYGDIPIFITENGFSDEGTLEDQDRINFLKLYLTSLHEAIYEDGVNVKGYAVWSLMDNFEWLAGYTERFGLYHVDFNDQFRKRTPKRSAHWYKNLIKTRRLQDTSEIKKEL